MNYAFAPNFYLQWRAERLAGKLAEKRDSAPPEMLLQQVWLYQRIVPERLQTSTGEKVKVLHPGFWNHEPGPDFRKAMVQFGDDRPIVGDVEIDIEPGGWKQHAHATNPSYKGVILHVTWRSGVDPAPVPSVSLAQALDSTVPELSFWLGIEPKPLPEGVSGQCAGPLRHLQPATLRRLLRQAAEARLQCKAEQIQARARQTGWESALWEALLGALGYKRNTWPMRRIAALFPKIRDGVVSGPEGVIHLQARLLGVSGLLPKELRHAPEAEAYLRQIWNVWWRERTEFMDDILPENLWSLGGIRPANHPQRRLALAAHWIARQGLAEELEDWLLRKIELPDLLLSLGEILRGRHDSFWSYRWTLSAKPFREPQILLGDSRLTDLAMNVILPWLYVRALAGQNEQLAMAALSRYLLWPAGEDNSVLKLARKRLFGGVPASFLKTAGEQQALLQIVRDFCDHSNAICEQCPFPEMVDAAAAAPAGNATVS